MQLDPLETATLPLSAAQRRVGPGDVADQRQEQRERMLRRRDHVAARRVEDHDAATRGEVEVDVVHAHTGPPQHLQLLAGFDDLGRHLGATADDESIVRLDDRAQLLRADPAPRIHNQPGGPPQDLDPLRGDVIRQQHPHPDARLVHANLDPVFV